MPTKTGSGLSVLVKDKSALVSTVVVAVLVLFVETESSSFNWTVAVVVTKPVFDDATLVAITREVDELFAREPSPQLKTPLAREQATGVLEI